MDTPERTDVRLTDLEIKASFSEDLLRQVAGLREQIPADGQSTPRSLRDELPPHY